MKKKFFTFALLLLFTETIFSLGIGGQLNSTLNFNKINESSDFSTSFGAAFAVKPDLSPFYYYFDTSYNPFSSYFMVRLAADYWIFEPRLTPFVHFFCGLGALAGSNIYSDRGDLVLAPRAFFGINGTLFDGFLEPFIQITGQPSFTFDFLNNEQYFSIEVPVAIGVRIWD